MIKSTASGCQPMLVAPFECSWHPLLASSGAPQSGLGRCKWLGGESKILLGQFQKLLLIRPEEERTPGSCLFSNIEENTCFVRACWEPWVVAVITLHHCFSTFLSYQSTSLKILIQLISSILCIMAFAGATIIVADVFRPQESVLAPFENAGLKFHLTLIL